MTINEICNQIIMREGILKEGTDIKDEGKIKLKFNLEFDLNYGYSIKENTMTLHYKDKDIQYQIDTKIHKELQSKYPNYKILIDSGHTLIGFPNHFVFNK